MNSKQLTGQIVKKGSFLCVGLDSDIKKIPVHLLKEEDPVFSFNKAIIDATSPYAVAYKPNLAFYESMGAKGWETYEKTTKYIKANYPEIMVIADAKRGDIGNTSEMYAKAFFDHSCADAITLSPYMGVDTVAPFLKYEGKWAMLLALTSNSSSSDFETEKMASGEMLYEMVIRKSLAWGSEDNIMYVVGATKAEMFTDIRKIAPNHFFLVPGVGAQGGSLKDVARYGMTKECGLLVNSSRAIIYADKTKDFAEAAAEQARILRDEMSELMKGVVTLK